MEIKVYATLRAIVGGKSITLNGGAPMTVGNMIEQMFAAYPAMRGELLRSDGEMHSAFHFFINGRDARYLDGPETIVTAQDDVRVFPPVGGGR